jgi:hypothetical protein
MAIICVFLVRRNLTLLNWKEIELIKTQKEDDVWEAIQLINGDIFIYRNGFKEEAPVQNVFKRVSGKSNQFIRLDSNLVFPVKNSMIRLNRTVISFAWYIDPESSLVRELKAMAEDKG